MRAALVLALRSYPESSVCGVRLESGHTAGAFRSAETISLLPHPGGPTNSGLTGSPGA